MVKYGIKIIVLGIKMRKGDIIRWEFEAWIVEDGKEELFDTTNEELAKEHGIHDPNIKYGPMVSVVGVGRLIKGIDEKLLKARVGKEYEVVIEPQDAYGERDPKLVKIHSYRELARQKIEPEVGKEVIINNKRGRIVTVTPGRVVIDFNHPLAGKTLKYRYKVVERIEEPAEKVKAIIEMDYGKDVEQFKITVEGDDIVIELPDVCKYDSNWAVAKYAIVGDIRDYVGNKNIKFIELYEKKEEKKKTTRKRSTKKKEVKEEGEEKEEEAQEEKPKKRGRPKKKEEEKVEEVSEDSGKEEEKSDEAQ